MVEFNDRRKMHGAEGRKPHPIHIAVEALRRNMQRYHSRPVEDVRLEGIRPIGHFPIDDPLDYNENPHATHYATFSMRIPEIEHHFPRSGSVFAVSATEGEPEHIYQGAWRPYGEEDWNHFIGRHHP